MKPNDVGDVTAGFIGLGSWMAWLPEAAALLTILWTLIRIYEWIEGRLKARRSKGEQNGKEL